MSDLSREESAVLARASGERAITATLYCGGEFSEPEFVLFGVLERLVIRKRLTFVGRSGDQLNAAYHYALAESLPAQAA